jgi:hypothetical protein
MNTWRSLLIFVVLLSLITILVSGLIAEPSLGFRRIPRVHQGLLAPLLQGKTSLHRIVLLLATLLANYLLGVIVLYTAPKRMRALGNAFWMTKFEVLRFFAVGILATVFFSIVAFLSALSTFTFPATLLLGTSYFIAGYGGIAAMSHTLGQKFFSKADWQKENPLIHYGLGILIFFALIRLPAIGPIFFVLIWILGIGISVGTRMGSEARWTLAPLMEKKEP